MLITLDNPDTRDLTSVSAAKSDSKSNNDDEDEDEDEPSEVSPPFNIIIYLIAIIPLLQLNHVLLCRTIHCELPLELALSFCYFF